LLSTIRQPSNDNKKRPKKNTTMGTNSKKRRRQLAGGGTGEAAIVFNPDARKEYLQGFSKRKGERRAYGLAMQKMKDRKARLEQRAELKRAEREQVEQAERQKESEIEEYMLDRSVLSGMGFTEALAEEEGVKKAPAPARGGNGKSGKDEKSKAVDKVEVYHDEVTRDQWGGEVIVTTSTRFPGTSDDEDDDDDNDDAEAKKRAKKKPKRMTVDEEQEYAGNVEKYLAEVKSKLPSMRKKKKDAQKKHKGVHGASNMKGVSGPADMKIAKRALDRFQKKGGGKNQPQASTSRKKRR
jgi:ribosomal RNA-processing protein 17